jgi:hypothetical protein
MRDEALMAYRDVAPTQDAVIVTNGTIHLSLLRHDF